jgi:predicted component of type VI protein secretion system
MAIELHIAGADFETVRLLHPGAPELILGRDASCDVNLPDPDRNISRRHLAVWNKGAEVHFRVLSAVNGVDMPFGYAPPGAQGALPFGQVLKLGNYSLQARLPAPPVAQQDPWAVFDRDPGSSDATLPRAAMMTASPTAQSVAEGILPEEDPFGDWGFQSTFGPDSGSEPPPQGPPTTSDLAAFFKGLGLDRTNIGALTPVELEAAGRSVRIALEGLFMLYAAHHGPPQERTAGAGVMAVKDNNPLKTHWPDDTKLQFLFGGRAASIGFVSPQRALGDIVAEMVAHDTAMALATKAALEATVQEFAPDALKERLLGTGSKLFENTRAWDAYARYYNERAQTLGAWVQQLLDQHFAPAYLRESLRIKRETGAPPQ